MSGKAIRETLAALGVIASLVFVGYEVQQSNVQARATAFQAMGVAQAEFHEAIAADDRLSVLYAEHGNPDRLRQWTQSDWAKYFRSIVGYVRLMETVQIQVEQRILPPDAMVRLGYVRGNQFLEIWPAFACVWPRVRNFVGESLRAYIEEVPELDRYDCRDIDLSQLLAGGAGAVEVQR